jgi:Uncharacterized conserved protein
VNLTKRLKVEPGSKVKLSRIDPDFHGTHKSDDETKAELQHNLSRITDLQRKLYADRRHCLLVVLQGIDGAGKDGTCWHVVSAMDPQGVNVVGFKQPTQEERDHDFLWRVHPHAPGLGRVAVFNRSHYEDVLVARVHKLVPKDVWKQRFEFINDWERLLVEEKNTTILKFFLYISKDEQLARFKERLDDPGRHGKSAIAIIPNANFGINTLMRSRRLFQSVRPDRPHGSSSRRTTSGSGILRSPRSLRTRWKI